MKKPLSPSALFIIIVISFLAAGCHPESVVVENESASVEFSNDLTCIRSLTDKTTGRNYSSGTDSVLYILHFGEDYDSCTIINSSMSSARKMRKTGNDLEIEFTHEGDVPLTVICNVGFPEGSSLLNWTIKVSNKSGRVLCAVEYPVISCNILPGLGREGSGVLYPFLEGVLLTGMNHEGARFSHEYPGQVSAQFMYYFDKEGGLYYASRDGDGYKKALNTRNLDGKLYLSQKYLLPIEFVENVEVPYSMVTGFSGGRWESGAEIYREWAVTQKWCLSTLNKRQDVPAWLKKPNLFINYSYVTPPFATVEGADKIIKNYHEFFKMPIVATGFGWEKNQIWVNPDCFPPIHGDAYYKELASKVHERGDHLHAFTSGFRWSIMKPVTLPDNTTGYTDFDDTDDFMKHGKDMAVIDLKGEMILDKRAWAHNYLLCPGSPDAKQLVESLFIRLFEMGMTGVDLDQNLGAEVQRACYSDQHGHPKGIGIWHYHTMLEFLQKLLSKAREISPDNFLAVEEPCEIFIPQFDTFHGRAFTDTQWPVMGPGGVSVPLYIYLYHPYQIGYSGWIDPGFSALGDERYGLARSFIFGMYPGVRTTDSYNQTTGYYSPGASRGKFDLTSGIISEELKILKSYTELFKQCPEFLVHGKMIREALIEGCDTIKYIAPGRNPLPFPWQTVQGIEWSTESGKGSAYALASLSAEPQSDIRVKIDKSRGNKLEMIYYDSDSIIRNEIQADDEGWIALELKPWQLCIIIQS